MTRKYLKYFTLLFLIAIVILIITGFRSRAGGKLIEFKTKADSEGVFLSIYNSNGKEVMTLSCKEEQEEDTGSGIERILMKDVKVSIFKEGKMDKDIFVTSREGYRENDNNFLFKKNARIFAEDLLITSRSFYLKDRNILTTQGRVKIKVKGLEGIAAKGLKYNIKSNLLSLREFNGKLTKNDKVYHIKCNQLRLPDAKKKVRLDGVKHIKQVDSRIKCKVFEFYFTDDYKFITGTLAFGKIESYLKKESGKDEYQEIMIKNARKINNFYIGEGKLKQTLVLKSKRIIIKNASNLTDIKTSDADITYNPENGFTRKIILPKKARLKNRGKKDFDITANQITVSYSNGGDIRQCIGNGQCQFKIEDFTGTTGNILYNLEKEVIRLKGKPSYVTNKNNRFEANKFSIEINKKVLHSSGAIKSMVSFKEKNVFFSKNPIIILSRKVQIFHEQNRIIYDDGVRMVQGDTKLEAGTIDISEDDDISASKDILFQFRDQKGELRLQGQSMSLKTKEKSVKIQKQCVLERREKVVSREKGEESEKTSKLQAELLQIKFGLEEIEEIFGAKDVTFKREDQSFKAEKLYWDYLKSLVRFVGSVVWEKKNQSKTTAEEIVLNLNDDSITVKSGKKERTETIID